MGRKKKGVSGATPSGNGGARKPWGTPKTKPLSGDRCADTHPVLKLPGGLEVYGGSCVSPVVEDADVYIGFDHGMRDSKNRLPWTTGWDVRMLISDQGTPPEPDDFAVLINWTIKQLNADKKVHAGCIGGHGRTGMFLAALAYATGVERPIEYVREKYCEKAVESKKQVEWLQKHYGGEADAKPRQYKKEATANLGTSLFQPQWGNKNWSDTKGVWVRDQYDDTGTPMNPEESIWG